jgi:cation-transporting ATPase 13A1
MITGDNTLTACHVASQLQICTKPVLTLSNITTSTASVPSDSPSLPSGWWWLSLDETIRFPALSVVSDVDSDNPCNSYDLCVPGTGDAFDFFMNHILSPQQSASLSHSTQRSKFAAPSFKQAILHVKVWARVSPDQKVS